MKHLIIRCEDHAEPGEHVATLLEGARVPYLQQLGQAGAAGVIRAATSGSPEGRLAFHRAMFGLAPQDQEAAPGRCYAAGANLHVGSDESAWCCELMTQRDGIVIDPGAGHIPTQESHVLLQAIDEAVGSETMRWEAGEGNRHILVTTDEVLRNAEPDAIAGPETLEGKAWERALPKGPVGASLRSLISLCAEKLAAPPINRVRVDLGENPANLIWLWGPARGGETTTFRQRGGKTGAMVTDRFEVRGFARAFGLSCREAGGSFEAETVQRLKAEVFGLLERYDRVEVHLSIDSADAVERLCAMERIDQILVKPLTEALPQLGAWRFLMAMDDRRSGMVPVVAIGTGLPQHPVVHLDPKHLAGSRLAFQDAAALRTWFEAML